MTLAFSATGDFLDVTDGLETVTITNIDPTSSDTATTGVSALRRAINKNDFEQFGGIGIEPTDTIWHFPTASVAFVQQGDKITTAGSEIWTVIDAKKQTLSSRWRCLCRANR